MSTIFTPKTFYWLKILSKFISVEIFVQVLALTSSVLLIRTLDEQQYAYFTIAFGMQSTINVLSNTGIGSGLLSIGGEIWQDKYRLSQLIKTAMHLRYYMAVITIVIFIPIMIWLLAKNGASNIDITFLVLALLIGLYFELNNTVLSIVIKLHSQMRRLQCISFLRAVIRLLCLATAYFSILNASVALLASSIASGIDNWALNHWVADNIYFDTPINKEYRSRILNIIKYQSPESIFSSIKGQMTIWLISIFGGTQNLAGIGVLGRLSFVFRILNSIMRNIVFPMFARCKAPKILQKRYLYIIGMLCFILIIISSFCVIFSDQVFWFLGSKYYYLKNELLLMVANNGIQYLINNMWGINMSKGWVEYAWLNIPSTITLQVFLLFFLDISTIKGVLMFSILSCIPWLIINIFTTYKNLWLRKTTV